MSETSSPLSPTPLRSTAQNLPSWAQSLVERYESNAASQFMLYGNIATLFCCRQPVGYDLARSPNFSSPPCSPVLMWSSATILAMAFGLKKAQRFSPKWPAFQESQKDWKSPRPAVETLTRYFRYCANLKRLNQPASQVGCIIKNADLLVPPVPGGLDYNLNALASLIRDWANDSLLTDHALATFLISENMNDLHPLIVNNPRAGRIKIDLPTVSQIAEAFRQFSQGYSIAMSEVGKDIPAAAEQLAGTTLSAIESVVKTKQHRKQPLVADDLAKIKKELVENDTNGLIEFLETKRTLNNVSGLDTIKAWLRQDIELWRKNDTGRSAQGLSIMRPRRHRKDLPGGMSCR